MKIINLDTINNTPIFTIPDTAKAQWFRVLGAKYQPVQNRWLFPAFPPFMETVLQDIYKVNSNISLSPDAQTWVNSFCFDKTMEMVRAQHFKTSPYNHQYEGVAELLHNYRWILQWEMGTGKSKVVVDAVDFLKLKTLILCPLIGLANWVNEVNLHGNNIKVLGITENTVDKKRKQIAEAHDYDIVIATYDTIRSYGIPRLLLPTVKLFNEAGRIPHTDLRRILTLSSDPQLQVEATRQWLEGAAPREVEHFVRTEIQDKAQWLLDYPYQVIVADESHKLKRNQSSRTQVGLELSKKAMRRYLLTGTLSHGDPRDLYPQLKFLAPYLTPEDYHKFCERHVIVSPRNKHLVVGFKNLHIINNRVSRVSSTRKLEDCVELPERQFLDIEFELSEAQRHTYNAVVKEWIIDRPNESVVDIKNAAIRVSKLLQLCSGFVYVPTQATICSTCPNQQRCITEFIVPGECPRSDLFKNVERETLQFATNPKLDALTDRLDSILPDTKAIVWANFTHELDDIEHILQKNKWGYVRVDGSSTRDIANLANQFQTDPKCSVYLGQISTAIAINLTAAKYTFYYSRSWSLDHRLQSLGRNYRIGQTQKTVVYDLYAARSLEVQQLAALNNKQNIAKLLTEKINCILCKNYRKCLESSIKPWSDECVLSTCETRMVAQAVEIYGGPK